LWNRVCSGVARLAAVGMVAGAGCYQPDPAEGLPCSAQARACPDGQACGADNICRAAGSIDGEPDAEVCSVSDCEIEILSSGSTSASAVTAAHPEYIFWTSDLDRTLFRTGKANLQTNEFDRGDSPYAPLGLAASDAEVFWSDNRIGGRILARSVNGGGAPEIIASGQDFPLYVVADPDFVYWTNAGGLVLRATRIGGRLSMLATVGAGPAGALALDDTNVYFADQGGGRVFTIAKDGSGELRIISANQGSPLSVAVDDQHVYWTNIAAGQIKRRTKIGGEVQIVAEQQGAPAFIVAGPNHVYWTNRADGRIMSAEKTTLETQILAEGQDLPYGIALEGEALYWVNQGGPYRLLRLHPCACR
jgi:hypothetical protein